MKKIFILFALILSLTFTISASDKALIIGIENYKNSPICQRSDPKGCVNPTLGAVKDAEQMARLADKKFGFKEILILTDAQATTQKIRESVEKWLIPGTKPGDRVFIFYSGHGYRIDDTNGDEVDDQKDEIITPFDVETYPTLKNYIVDDEINQWLISLQNRRVVMVFDSCHSGTISRSFDRRVTKNSKYLGAEANVISRSFTDGVFSAPKTRDLSTVVDKYMNNYTGNAVIISASQPNQQAVWFDTNGSLCKEEPRNPNWRGALAYLFENAVENKNITVKELDKRLKLNMAELAEQGRICKPSVGFQIPEIVYSSLTADQPLWGGTIADNIVDQRPIEALQNPNSQIIVRLNILSHNNSYKIGETINYSVYLSEPLYLYVVVFSEKDEASCLFPNADNKDNFLKPGNHNMPSGEARKPTGKDIWVAIASRQKLNLTGEKDIYKWSEIFKEIGLNELQGSIEAIVRSRGVGSSSKLKNTDWQATSLVMTTLK